MDDLKLLAKMKKENYPIDEIHHEEEIVHEEMHTAAIDLEEAMFVSMVSFSFPVRMLVLRLYAKYTERHIAFSLDEFVDLGLAACVGLWFGKFIEYSFYGEADETIATTPEEIFMYNVIQDI